METYSKQNVLVNSAPNLIAVTKANLPDQTRELMKLCEMKGGSAN